MDMANMNVSGNQGNNSCKRWDYVDTSRWIFK